MPYTDFRITLGGMKLNPSQKAAVQIKDGPAMIIAGPGSGKTAVLTSRICHLIRQESVPAEDILAVTFSRKAADHLKERFLSMHAGKGLPFFGTFHSIFFMILRYAENMTAENIATGEQKKKLMELAARPFLEKEETEEAVTEHLLDEVSRVKSGMYAPENYIPQTVSAPVFRRIYASYTAALRKKGLIDFDDMLLLCRRILTERPDIRTYWQRRFRYILVDEFQDINRIQYECIRILAAPGNNLFAVGDDDQSIYAFRGAQPQIMLSFLKDYPEAVRIPLSVSYRCGKGILDSAARMIAENRKRFHKDLKSGNPSSPGRFRIHRCPAQSDEYKAIAEEVSILLRRGEKPEEIAILTRRSFEFPAILRILNAYGIPESSGVALMTMHAAKGLEFRHVFIPDANEGILPAKKIPHREALEEERRIFYVAMTRASDTLDVYYAERIRRKKTAPSRLLGCFLKDRSEGL